MKRFIISACTVFLFAFVFLSSCDDKTSKSDDALLWKISGNGLEEPSYIFGTNGFVATSFLDSIAGLKESFDKSAQFVGEFILLPDNEESIKDSLYKTDQLLVADGAYTMLSDGDKERLNKGLADVFSLSVADISDNGPNAMLNRYMMLLSYRTDPTYNLIFEKTMSEYFRDLAMDQNKNIVSLESVDDRVKLLSDTTSFGKLVQILLNSLENVDENVNNLAQIKSSYKKQSLSDLHEVYAKSENKGELVMDLFQNQYFLDRMKNKVWAGTVSEMMKDKSSFIAVGALHLAGEGSLLSELKDMGYTVEPVSGK